MLFLDELPEFHRNVLEVLREPLESGHITISRAGVQADFPANFQLVAAMNPCPCGYLGDLRGNCNCSSDRVQNYRARLSGPLLDRIDIQMTVQRPPASCMRADSPLGESTAKVAARVMAARARQLGRAGVCNAELDGAPLAAACNLHDDAGALLERAMDQYGLSPRGHQRMLRVALTIADLAGADSVGVQAVAEALSLRGLQGRVVPA